ncbi:MAG: C40 family peptidase [Treponema sp.]|nr:C40 family peptidase [Treponema sp.]
MFGLIGKAVKLAIILLIIFVVLVFAEASMGKYMNTNVNWSGSIIRLAGSPSWLVTLKDTVSSVIDGMGGAPAPVVVPRPAVSPGGPAPQPAPPPKPGPQPKITDNPDIRNAILASANRYRGARYHFGAQNPPSRFDCSGLIVQAYYEATGTTIPRTSAMMWAMGRRVDRTSVQPGDIIVFGRGSPSHVAIYHDNVNMLHAASAGRQTGVILSRQDEQYWASRFLGYVTFVDVPINITRSAANSVVSSEFPVELSNTLQSNSDPMPAVLNTGLNVIIYNDTGVTDRFDIYFHKAGTDRNSGENDKISVRNEDTGASKVFVGTETGQYYLVIANRAGNILFEQTFMFEE